MAPHRGPRRARIDFTDAAAKQVESITNEAELHALDRTLVVIFVDPEIGEPIAGGTAGPQLRQYTDEVEQGRWGRPAGSARTASCATCPSWTGHRFAQPISLQTGGVQPRRQGPAGAALSPSPHCAAPGSARRSRCGCGHGPASTNVASCPPSGRPDVSLISDWRDLSRALEYLYEAAGSPSLREIRDKSGNPHALSLSSLRRIVLRITRSVDERQLLAIVHGCGITDHDDLWRAAWTKVSSRGCIDLGPDLAVAMLERFQRGQNLAIKAYAARAVTGRHRSVPAETRDEQSGGGAQRPVRQLQDRRLKIAKITLPENEKRTAS